MSNKCLILGFNPNKWFEKDSKKNCKVNELLKTLKEYDSWLGNFSSDKIFIGMKGIIKIGHDKRNYCDEEKVLSRGIYATFEVKSVSRIEKRVYFKIIDNFFAQNEIVSDDDTIDILTKEKFNLEQKSADIISLVQYEKIRDVFISKLKKGKHRDKIASKRIKINQYTRNEELRNIALSEANYECEIDALHTSFLSKKTNKNYMESHHLIQLKEDENFPNTNLDILPNIICLCPNCHRKIHHGKKEEVIEMLKVLLELKKATLNKCLTQDITIEDLEALYFE